MSKSLQEEFSFGDRVENLDSGILVAARAAYIPPLSNPGRNTFAFAYIIEIANQSERTVQLLSRHWVISNAEKEQFEVEGEGVVGKKPVIKPGERFEYDSWTRLDTPLGSMSGSYTMIVPDSGVYFTVGIPAMELVAPRSLN